MALQITYRRRVSLQPSANNTRTHSPEQVRQIADSIREFGFTQPILIDPNGDIIAGEGRWLASGLLAAEGTPLPGDEVPCIVLAGLSERQRRAYIIADNRIAQNSGWDAEKLAVELSALSELDFPLEVTGFTDDELAAILGEGGILPPNPAPSPRRRRDREVDAEGNPVGTSKMLHTCPSCGHQYTNR